MTHSALFSRIRRTLCGFLIALSALVLLVVSVHVYVRRVSRIPAPTMIASQAEIGTGPKQKNFVRKRGSILEVHLSGSPEQLGHAHASLLAKEMIENEGALWKAFELYVPSLLARSLILDLGSFRFRSLGSHIPEARRRELWASSLGYTNDPYSGIFPTYQRFSYLNALYDLSLSFERSPLIGCTSAVVSGQRSASGHTMLARVFDFEVDEIFDRGKAVFIFREDGKIPLASVGWPGLIGVVSGMNAEGLAVVIHGGRASQPTSEGEPVLMTLRDLLGRAHNTEEAVRILEPTAPMVSHLILLADKFGKIAIVERAPGEKAFTRWAADSVGLSNHFEGPLASDPANLRIRAETSTDLRLTRMKELLAENPSMDLPTLFQILRDRKAPGGNALPFGDRRSINADIATHGIVADCTTQDLWVSEGPHLQGRFIKFPLARLWSGEGELEQEVEARD